MSRPAPTRLLLALACAAAAAMLAASQFMDIFHLTPPGGEALDAITSDEQHGAAMLILALFALIMVVVTLAMPRRPIGGQELSPSSVAAGAIAACGVVALLLFLIVDLPDVNKIGTVDDPRESFVDAKAKPQAGFWFELFGSLVLAGCGIGLATLRERAEEAESGPLGSAVGERGVDGAEQAPAARTERVG
jgi:hypothetical protein